MFDIPHVVNAGRMAASAIMRDKCVIERSTGETTLDPVTYQEIPKWDFLYEGQCRLKVAASAPVDAAGRVYIVTDALLQLPIGDIQFEDDDRVTMTACEFDPDLVGAILTVKGRRPLHSQATMRRLQVSEVI